MDPSVYVAIVLVPAGLLALVVLARAALPMVLLRDMPAELAP